MRALIALTVLSFASLNQSPHEQVEIAASLSGYNLLSPTDRCCGFEFSVSAGRATTLRVTSGPAASDRDVRASVSVEALAAVSRVLDEQLFARLPPDVGMSPVDGDIRVIRVRKGRGAWHQVRIGESAFGNAPGPEERRAIACWRAVRALVDVPGANVQ